MSSLKPNQLKAPSRITRSATKAAKSSAVNADVLSPSAASPPKSKLSKLTQTTSEAITAQSEVGSVRRGEPDLKMADRSVMQTKEENARIKDLEQSLLLEKTRAETLQRELSDTKVAIASEKSHVADLEEKLAMNNDEVEELRQELMESIRENARIKELEISLILEKTKAETLQRQLSDTKVAIASEKSHVAKLEEELATNNDEVEELRQELSLVCQSKKDGPRRKYQNVESAAQILAADKEKLKAELHDAKRELRRMNLFFDMFQISDGETVSEVFGNIDEQMSQESLHAVDVELQNPHQEMQVLSRSEEHKAAQDINYEKQELEKKYQNLNSAAQILAADKEKLKAELHDANKELRRMNLFIDMFQISDGETVSEVFGNIDEQMSQESLHAVDVELQNPHQEMQVLSRSEEHKAAQKINYEKQELEKKYQNLNSAAQILAADKEKLKAVLHEMKSQLDKLVQKNLELENSRDELIQARIVMEKETHLLEKHYNKIIDEQICIISEKKPVSQRLTQSKVDMARKQSALYREHKMTLARAQELENKVSVLLIEQENLVRAVEALTSERDELASERDELASERDELASERDELASEREELASEREELASEREELASEREELASEREELASERDELASKVKDLHQENQKILVNYAELTVEMAVVTNQLYYSEKQNEELQLTSERIRMLHTEIMMKIKKKAIKLKHVFKMLSKAQQ